MPLFDKYIRAVACNLHDTPEGLAMAVTQLGEDYSKFRAWNNATLTGAVEPVGGLLGAGLGAMSGRLLPCELAFVAGACSMLSAMRLSQKRITAGTRKRQHWAWVRSLLGPAF